MSLALHSELRGKLETVSKRPILTREDLSLLYTPGVAEPCRAIARDPEYAYEYTLKSNTVAVISDGSAVLGLGNIGPLAALPVMEGKCVLFREFAGINAFPRRSSGRSPTSRRHSAGLISKTSPRRVASR